MSASTAELTMEGAKAGAPASAAANFTPELQMANMLGLCEAQMVGVARLLAVDKARLGSHKAPMGFAATAPRLGQGEDAFVDFPVRDIWHKGRDL